MTEQTASKVPQIRFKGFEGEWEEKTLGSISDSYSGGTPSVGDRSYYNGSIPFIRSAEINATKTELAITETGLKNSAAKLVKKGDVLYALYGATSGEVGISNIDGAINQAILAITPKSDFSSHFLAIWLRCKKGSIVRTYLQGGQGNLSGNIVKELVLAIPLFTEQTQIGGYFRELDSLIGLHQRKHDKLVTLKKTMLQKMFPQPGATTPEIRFKGFLGDWAEKKLGEAMANVANNTLSRADLNYRSGLARNVHYGDILVRFGEVLDAQSDSVPFVTNDAVVKKLMSSNLENGDIVLADAAEDEMVGKCTEIQNVGDQIVLAGLHTIPLRPMLHFAPFYLGYYLNSDGYHNQLLPIMQGTKVFSISKTAIKQTAICFPVEEAEQQKIGTYFRTLDELISKHATQLQKLQQIKSACLQRMFV